MNMSANISGPAERRPRICNGGRILLRVKARRPISMEDMMKAKGTDVPLAFFAVAFEA